MARKTRERRSNGYTDDFLNALADLLPRTFRYLGDKSDSFARYFTEKGNPYYSGSMFQGLALSMNGIGSFFSSLMHNVEYYSNWLGGYGDAHVTKIVRELDNIKKRIDELVQHDGAVTTYNTTQVENLVKTYGGLRHLKYIARLLDVVFPYSVDSFEDGKITYSKIVDEAAQSVEGGAILSDVYLDTFHRLADKLVAEIAEAKKENSNRFKVALTDFYDSKEDIHRVYLDASIYTRFKPEEGKRYFKKLNVKNLLGFVDQVREKVGPYSASVIFGVSPKELDGAVQGLKEAFPDTDSHEYSSISDLEKKYPSYKDQLIVLRRFLDNVSGVANEYRAEKSEFTREYYASIRIVADAPKDLAPATGTPKPFAAPATEGAPKDFAPATGTPKPKGVDSHMGAEESKADAPDEADDGVPGDEPASDIAGTGASKPLAAPATDAADDKGVPQTERELADRDVLEHDGCVERAVPPGEEGAPKAVAGEPVAGAGAGSSRDAVSKGASEITELTSEQSKRLAKEISEGIGKNINHKVVTCEGSEHVVADYSSLSDEQKRNLEKYFNTIRRYFGKLILENDDETDEIPFIKNYKSLLEYTNKHGFGGIFEDEDMLDKLGYFLSTFTGGAEINAFIVFATLPLPGTQKVIEIDKTVELSECFSHEEILDAPSLLTEEELLALHKEADKTLWEDFLKQYFTTPFRKLDHDDVERKSGKIRSMLERVIKHIGPIITQVKGHEFDVVEKYKAFISKVGEDLSGFNLKDEETFILLLNFAEKFNAPVHNLIGRHFEPSDTPDTGVTGEVDPLPVDSAGGDDTTDTEDRALAQRRREIAAGALETGEGGGSSTDSFEVVGEASDDARRGRAALVAKIAAAVDEGGNDTVGGGERSEVDLSALSPGGYTPGHDAATTTTSGLPVLQPATDAPEDTGYSGRLMLTDRPTTPTSTT